MNSIIVVFPKRENAVSIRNILIRAGLEVSAVCTTGAKALQYAEAWDGGIVVCGFRMPDMQYTELREWLPEQYDILLAASADRWRDVLPDGVVGLPMPFKAQDLISTVEMMVRARSGRKKKERSGVQRRSSRQQEVIDQAKALLMERNNMTEDEAHRYLQKSSMQSGNSMAETARMVIMIMDE